MSNDLTQDWNNLATTIRGVGTDQANAALGLAKFMSEDDVRKKEIEVKNQALESGAIDLRAKQAKEAYLNQPFYLSQALAGADNNLIAKIPDFLKVVGAELKDPNDPNSTLIHTKTGTELSNRDIQPLIPVLTNYIKVSRDPVSRTTNNLLTIKSQLGAQSEGPLMSPEEQQAFMTDPEVKMDPVKNALFEAYRKAEGDFNRYKLPENALAIQRQRLGVIEQLQAAAKAVGGDSSELDSNHKAISTDIAQIEKQNSERQYRTGNKAKIVGQPSGLPVSATVFDAMNKDIVSSENNAATNAAHLKAAEINKSATLGAAKMRLEEASRSSEHNQFANATDPDLVRARVVASFDKEYTPDAMGKRYITDPTTKERIEMTPEQMDKMLTDRVNRSIQAKKQEAQDTGVADRLKLKLTGVSRAKPTDRAEFNQSAQGITQEIGSLTGPNDLVFKKNVVSQLNAAKQALNTGDPTQVKNAKETLSAIITQVNQYKQGVKQDIPANIKKSVQNMEPNNIDRASGIMGLENYIH